MLSYTLDLNKTYILSVSGGIDSMTLLFDMYSKGYKLVVVHFNHQKRPESVLEAKLVSDFCSVRHIPYHYFILDIPKHGNFQSQARLMRKTHLKEVADLSSSTHIVTAHHLDDLCETFLMRLLKRDHLFNLSSMQQNYSVDGYTYVKPLLYTLKKEINAYAHNHQVHYMEDSSNLENTYTRNKIRNLILPKLIKDGLTYDTIISCHKQITTSYDIIHKQTLSYLSTHSSFDVSKLKNLNPFIFDDIIMHFLKTASYKVSISLIHEIKKQFLSSKPTIKFVLNDYILSKNYGLITFERKPLHESISYDAIFSHKKPQSGHAYIEICYNKLDLPLHVRKKKTGDVLSYDFGHKKLARLLIDKKVPSYMRNDILCITDNNDQIIWIPNLYVNKTLGNNECTYIILKEEK